MRALIKEFESLVGQDNVLHDETDRATYSYDAAVLDPALPGVVLRPTSSEILGKVVKLCKIGRAHV